MSKTAQTGPKKEKSQNVTQKDPSPFPQGFSVPIEQLYNTACHLLQTDQHSEAITIFTLLTTYKPYIPQFWLGLGIAQQRNQQYKTALVAYEMAWWANEKDPTPYLYATDCYLALQATELGMQCLEKAMERADRFQYEELTKLATEKYDLLSSYK